MCVIACKYFPETGFVLVKNRDRNYKPLINIKQSFRNDIERILLWDNATKYTEGINEYGIAVLSAAVQVKKDENEGNKSNIETPEEIQFYSPDGKKIRTALLEKNIENVLQKLIELELPGNTLIATKDKCYLLEGDFSDSNRKNYYYKYIEIPKDQTCVRTNHGILINSGYKNNTGDEHMQLAYNSSVARLKQVKKDIEQINDPYKMLDCISNVDSKNKQLNPLRKSDTHGKSILVTTGQIMLVPSELTLHYRPIWCNIDINFDQLNSFKSKTFFELISTRKLIQSIKGFNEKVYLIDKFLLK